VQKDNLVDLSQHPLYPIFMAAIEQAMYGKGQRHGGNATPFLEQPWVHYTKMHGRGFLTGQAAKKLEEAVSTREGRDFLTEIFGAMVYLGMAAIEEQKLVDNMDTNHALDFKVEAGHDSVRAKSKFTHDL